MKNRIIIVCLALCIASMPLAADAKSNSSNLNKERLEVGRALLEVTSETLDSVLPYYTDDIVYFDPVVEVNGFDEMATFLYKMFVVASPNLLTIVHDEVAIDDMYMATWTMSGDFLGTPYEAKGMSILKFRPKSTDVYYQRDYYSEGDIMTTIPGLDQAIWGFRLYYLCAVSPNPPFCPPPPPPAP